jgi:hypothetical protein
MVVLPEGAALERLLARERLDERFVQRLGRVEFRDGDQAPALEGHDAAARPPVLELFSSASWLPVRA